MKSVAAILLLACACSGQVLVAPWGINAWAGAGASSMGPGVASVAMAGTAPMPPMITASQYHAQDELGQASFGYSHPGQAASSFRDSLGNQVGSYSYINPDGKQVQVSYVADAVSGFRVLSNDLPVGPAVPVQDTPEVAAAKAAHMAALNAARAPPAPVAAPAAVVAPAPAADPVPVAVPVPAAAPAPAAASAPVAAPVPIAAGLPVPVQETPEVAAARAAHMAAHAAAKSRQVRQAVLPLPMNVGPRQQVVAPVMTRNAVMTQVVNNPGFAMSYRVD